MNNNTTNFEYKQINSKYILSDMAYQRAIDINRVRRIIAQFNPNLVNPIKVSFRDKKYFVFDGQHTLSALKLKNSSDDLMVNCKVYFGLSQQDEAMLFAEQNGISRTVDSTAKFKALYAARDIDICEFYELTKRAGLKMDFTKGKAENKIVACTKAFKIFKSVSASEYIEILSMIKNAWNGISESFNTEILGGTYLFCRTYKGQFNPQLFSRQLSKVNPNVIVREGKVVNDGGDTRFARQMLFAYNKKTRGSRLSDEF